MSDIEKYLQSKGLSKSTVKYYYNEMLNFIAWCDAENIEPEQVTATEVTAYLKYLQSHKEYHSSTRSMHVNILKHFFSYQIKNVLRDDNPAKHIRIRGAKPKMLYPVLSKQELEYFYHSYQVPESTDENNNRNWFTKYRLSRQRNRAILGMMIYQGLCTDEINRITTKDVKLKEGTVFIAGTRTSNERTLELKPQQIIELMEYTMQARIELQKLHNVQSDYYFLSSKSIGGKAVQGANSLNIWKGLTADMRAHKNFINFKQIRASVITHWLKQYNLRQVQYMAGHRHISSTEAYLAGQIEDLQSDIDKYHPI